MGVPRKPDLLEIVLGPFADSKTIHGNEHRGVPSIAEAA
jgi:hypothetical protein